MIVSRVVVTAASLMVPVKIPVAPFTPGAVIPVLTVPGLPTLTANALPQPQVHLTANSGDMPAESSKSGAAQSFNAAAKLPEEFEGEGEPAAPAIPWSTTLHGQVWNDPQHWMNTLWKKPPSPALQRLVEAENRHSGAYFKAGGALVDKLEGEMTRRSFKTLVPKGSGNLRAGKGSKPRVDALQRKSDGRWKVVADPAAWLPAATQWASIDSWSPSPDGRKFILHMLVDGEKKTFLYDERKKRARELSSPDGLLENAVWAADGKTAVYSMNTLLLNKGKIQAVVTGSDDPPKTIFSSEDPSSFLTLTASADGARLLIQRLSYDNQDVWSLFANDLKAAPRKLGPSGPNTFVYADHSGGRFLVRANTPEGHFNLYEEDEAGRRRLVLAGSREADILEVNPVGDRILVTRRVASNPVLEVYDKDFKLLRTISFPEAHYELQVLPEVDKRGRIWLIKRSLLVPETLYSLDGDNVLRERSRTRLPGFDASAYSLEKRFVKSKDGAEVPITLLSKKGFTGPRPVYYSAYAAYYAPYDLDDDHSYNLAFARSLLDRGFVVAIAHARGGTEKGFQWMKDGQREKRSLSVDDFLAGAEWLVESGISEKKKIAIHSYSAGGVLISAALNRRPDLFGAAVINMGYLDFVNSLIDAGLPSGEVERTMYGDPTKPEDFAHMAAFSPIDNIPTQDFPPVLLNTASDDWAVLFHESLKYAARLRAARRSLSRVLVDIIPPGEGDHDGRHNRHARDAALSYAFVLRELGVEK
jgi:oligopeptidase B